MHILSIGLCDILDLKRPSAQSVLATQVAFKMIRPSITYSGGHGDLVAMDDHAIAIDNGACPDEALVTVSNGKAFKPPIGDQPLSNIIKHKADVPSIYCGAS